MAQGVQKQTKRAAKAEARMAKERVMEARLSRLEAELVRYAGYSESVERISGDVEGLTIRALPTE